MARGGPRERADVQALRSRLQIAPKARTCHVLYTLALTAHIDGRLGTIKLSVTREKSPNRELSCWWPKSKTSDSGLFPSIGTAPVLLDKPADHWRSGVGGH